MLPGGNKPNTPASRDEDEPLLRLELRLADKADWVHAFEPRDCTIFVAARPVPEIGRRVRVDLEVGRGGPRVIVRGEVVSRRDAGDASTPAGCSVALGPTEREKINYLNGFVRGGLLDLRERRRVPVRLPVTLRTPQGSRASYTRDINEEGVFVVSEEPLPEQAEVDLEVKLPSRDKPFALSGVVAHTVVVEDEDVPGMGIVFRIAGKAKSEFCRAIDVLEADFLAGKLPDDLLL